MKKPRYTALRQAEQGLPVAEFCRKLGVSETTFYHWKKRYAELGVAQPSGRPRIAQAGAVAICDRLELRAFIINGDAWGLQPAAAGSTPYPAELAALPRDACPGRYSGGHCGEA
jgi:hypothetical protein